MLVNKFPKFSGILCESGDSFSEIEPCHNIYSFVYKVMTCGSV
jgi:hypothetical protein